MYNRGSRTGPGSTYRPGSHRPPPTPTGGGNFPRTPISTVGDNAVYNVGGIADYGQSMRPIMQGPPPAGPGVHTRPGGQPSGGGQRGDYYRPGYQGDHYRPSDNYRPSYPPGWRPPGRPGDSGPGAAPPAPPPPPPPGPGQPGWRPPNYQPIIPSDVHTHAAFGGWSNSGGRPTGGHMLNDDLQVPHPDMAGYNNGTAGWGALRPAPGQPINLPGNHRLNGVYDYPYPPIQFHPTFSHQSGGAITKPLDNQTMFPEGVPHHAVGQMANNAWQSPAARFWPNETGDGGGWTGPSVIPPGYPGAGMPVKINGTYGPDGRVTGYWPSPNQPVPAPPPPAGASPTGGR